ncbi:MAG: hypothetical protein WCG47_30650 [Dermatophilaceae bacterium]
MDYTDRLRSLGLTDVRFAEGSVQPVDADALVLAQLERLGHTVVIDPAV